MSTTTEICMGVMHAPTVSLPLEGLTAGMAPSARKLLHVHGGLQARTCQNLLPTRWVVRYEVSMAPEDATAARVRREVVADLRSFVAAIDRRLPRLEHIDEPAIAKEAAALRARAMEMIARLEALDNAAGG